MKILVVHAPYRLEGGEERVVATQHAVLTARGHDVVITDGRGAGDVIARHRPDVVHVHKQFPTLSPGVYAAAADARVPVVQHLHNARGVCIQPFLVRDGVACDDCVGRSPWPGVVHRCYRGSAVQSLAAAAVVLRHRRLQKHGVSRYVAVSEAVAATMGASGVVPPERITVCMNGLDADPGERDTSRDEGYALYVGRLSYEKGVDLLLDAAARRPHVRFVVAGDGPERGALERRAGSNVTFTGQLDRRRVFDVIGRARVLVVPSRGQEPFGLGVIEAAARGVPALVARVGGLPEIVRDGDTGVVVLPFGADAIAAGLDRFDVASAHAMGAAARRRYEERFTPGAVADRLVAVYDDVLGSYAP